MKHDDIQALRPRDASSIEIQAALERARAMHEATSTHLEGLIAQGTELLLTGSAKELSAQDVAVRQARETLRQLESMTSAMRDLLRDAVRLEEIAALHAAYAALNLESNAAAFVTFWRCEYPALARKIAAGLELEAKVTSSASRANQITARLAALGESAPIVPNPSTLAVGAMLGNRRLSDLVRLPGIGGAPFVGTETFFEDVKEMRTVIDYENPVAPQPEEYDGRSGGNAGLIATRYHSKRIEVAVPQARQRSARDDTPLWPADPRAWTLPR